MPKTLPHPDRILSRAQATFPPIDIVRCADVIGVSLFLGTLHPGKEDVLGAINGRNLYISHNLDLPMQRWVAAYLMAQYLRHGELVHPIGSDERSVIWAWNLLMPKWLLDPILFNFDPSSFLSFLCFWRKKKEEPFEDKLTRIARIFAVPRDVAIRRIEAFIHHSI